MVDHIYGRKTVFSPSENERPNIFINELRIHLSYLKNNLLKKDNETDLNQKKNINEFIKNQIEGIEYYKNLAGVIFKKTNKLKENFLNELSVLQDEFRSLNSNHVTVWNNAGSGPNPRVI